MVRNPERTDEKWRRKHAPREAKPIPIVSSDPPRPILAYLRATGSAAFVFGLGAILMEEYFWVAITFFYIGLTVSIIDCLKEDQLRKKRYLVALFYFLCIAWLTLGVVWGHTKPEFQTKWIPGNYAEGTDVHGLKWKPEWSDLRITLANKNDIDLKDVDIEFLVDEPDAAVTQIGDFCSIASGNGITDIVGTDNRTGSQIHFPTSGASRHPYRILCSKIPANIDVQVVVAVAATDSSQKRRPQHVRVRGTYKAKLRPYKIALPLTPTDW